MNNYYTTSQYSEFIDSSEHYKRKQDDNKVFAKSTISGYSTDIRDKTPKHTKYYIRTYPNKKLYDPFPLYSISDNKNSFVDRICKGDNSYKEVTESIFNMYLNYLQSENTQWYNKAQRESSNL
jgi:hypothetical protein